MVTVNAYVSANTNPAPGNTTYLAPSLQALLDGDLTATQLDVFDPLGRFQRYFGSFDLASISSGDFSSSTFSGFKQFAGVSDATPLTLELSGASLNAGIVLEYILAVDTPGLVSVLLNGDDQITGSMERDTISGFAGFDFIKGLAENDSMFGNAGNDIMNGNQGDDVLKGGMDDDILRGGANDDRLFGQSGNDRLITGLGNDISDGGLGADTFVMSFGLEQVVDFNAAENDKIEILVSTPYVLGSTGPLGSGDATISVEDNVTTLLGVSLGSFDQNNSIVLV